MMFMFHFCSHFFQISLLSNCNITLLIMIVCCCFHCTTAQPNVGSTIGFPATSCEDVANRVCNAPSGLYYIRQRAGTGMAPSQYYCEMTMNGGGWLLLFDRATNSSACPSGLTRDSATGFCVGGCSVGCEAISVPSISPFDFNVIRGQFTIWSRGLHDGFASEGCGLDGVQVRSNKEKVWSFVAGWGTKWTNVDGRGFCPCGATLNKYLKNSTPTDDANKGEVDPFWTCDQPNGTDNGVSWSKLFDSPNYCGPSNDSVVGGQWFQRIVNNSDSISIAICRDQGPNDEEIGLDIGRVWVRQTANFVKQNACSSGTTTKSATALITTTTESLTSMSTIASESSTSFLSMPTEPSTSMSTVATTAATTVAVATTTTTTDLTKSTSSYSTISPSLSTTMNPHYNESNASTETISTTAFFSSSTLLSSTTLISGVAIGCIVLLIGIIAFVIVVFLLRRRKNTDHEDNENAMKMQKSNVAKSEYGRIDIVEPHYGETSFANE